MFYEQLLLANKKIVGAKQTLKSLKTAEPKGIKSIFIARDADKHITEPIVNLCSTKGVPVTEVDSMQLLGKACGIEVGCAAAAVIE